MAYHHGDLRRALLEGAIDLLAEGGPAHLTLRAAARRAGVSPAAPYRHFSDKQEMLAAVAEEGFLALERASAGAVTSGTTDPVEVLRQRGLAYVRFAIGNPAHYRVMFGPEIPDKRAYDGLQRAAAAAFEGLRGTLRGCAEAGYFPVEDIEIHATRAWAIVHGLASLHIDGQFAGDERTADKESFLRRVADVLRIGEEAFLRRV